VADQPTLRTARLILRPFRLDDAPAVHRLAGAREIAATTLNIPHPYDQAMAEIWIESHLPAWERREQASYAMTDAARGDLVGAVGLRLELAHRRAELGYWVGVPYWGQGYATEAGRAVLAFGFEHFGLERVHATHLSRNPASGRVMAKLGMRLEGCRRRHVLKWDRFEDLTLYGVLREEFAALTPS
jgi:RimJ/RimL family protein N-acetyltransferase